MITPGTIGRGKVPLEEPLTVADELAGDRAYARLELEHLVDEEERVAVGMIDSMTSRPNGARTRSAT